MTTIYLVGGAVRDALLGLESKDKDYVVVGSTAAEMEAQGFKPVGKDFPVFLHPVTGDEYALARTERKSGQGYKGFTVYAEADVTLEQDLGRRDLTINAMAQVIDGEIIDPHGGTMDLAFKVLRHVSDESFVEDPVRVLRLARFAARYADFKVARKTMELCKTMVSSGELDHLVAERVWQELAKGLMEKAPEKMFEFLHECGALKVLIPELDQLWGVPQPAIHHPEIDVGIHTMLVLKEAVKQNASLEVRWACLLHDLGKGITPKEMLPRHHDHENTGLPLVQGVCDRLKVPASCRDLAMMVCEDHIRCHRSMELTASSIVSLFQRSDAIRRPDRFKQFVQACECDAKGRLGMENRPYPEKDYVLALLEKIREVDAGAVAASCAEKHLIPERVYQARIGALKELLSSKKLDAIRAKSLKFTAYQAGARCVVNGNGDLYMVCETREFIDQPCEIVRICRSGLVQVKLIANPKRLYSFPKRNITVPIPT